MAPCVPGHLATLSASPLQYPLAIHFVYRSFQSSIPCARPPVPSPCVCVGPRVLWSKTVIPASSSIRRLVLRLTDRTRPVRGLSHLGTPDVRSVTIRTENPTTLRSRRCHTTEKQNCPGAAVRPCVRAPAQKKVVNMLLTAQGK